MSLYRETRIVRCATGSHHLGVVSSRRDAEIAKFLDQNTEIWKRNIDIGINKIICSHCTIFSRANRPPIFSRTPLF